jgi:uncharacterized Zn-binding protein involved in type VI secretion
MPGPVQRVGDSNIFGGTIISGDPTVLVNGRPVATLGQVVTPHFKCPKIQTHCIARTTSTNPTVLVNGRPICTSGDPDTCFDTRVGGSFDVIVG